MQKEGQGPPEGRVWYAPEAAERPVWLQSRDPGGGERKMRVREASRGQTTPDLMSHSTNFESYSMCHGRADQEFGGGWVAQSVRPPTSVQVSSSPTSGSLLSAQSLLRTLCLSLCPSPVHSHSLSCSLSKINIKKKKDWGTWVAQSVKHLTSAQVMISRFVSSSPTSGSALTAQSLEPALDSVSRTPPFCPSPAHALSLSHKNE